jgi:hypothetical protein
VRALPASRETNRTPNTINKRRTIAFPKELTTGTTPTAPAPRHSRRAVQFFFWTLALTARGRLRARHVDEFLLAGNQESMSVFGRLGRKAWLFLPNAAELRETFTSDGWPESCTVFVNVD